MLVSGGSHSVQDSSLGDMKFGHAGCGLVMWKGGIHAFGSVVGEHDECTKCERMSVRREICTRSDFEKAVECKYIR